jgi:hypothetical protein
MLDYTCADIIADVDIIEAELLAWNPWLANDCDSDLYVDLTGNDMRAVCIGIDTNVTTTTSSTSAAPTPTDTVSGCQEFYTVISGDDCSSIVAEFGITLAQFYAWNPSSMSISPCLSPIDPGLRGKKIEKMKLAKEVEQLAVPVQISGLTRHTVSRAQRQPQPRRHPQPRLQVPPQHRLELCPTVTSIILLWTVIRARTSRACIVLRLQSCTSGTRLLGQIVRVCG